MDLFVRVNQAYGSYFGISPPARACVGVDLPQGVRVRLECIAYAEQSSSDRQALHVQGLSYWAPANIGPYSQAITVREFVFSAHVLTLNYIEHEGRRTHLHIRSDRSYP